MAFSEQEFASYISDLGDKCLLANGVTLGLQLGIFDVMARLNQPSTVEEIAKEGHWKPRYVKEWLALMTCGKIVEYDKDKQRFWLPDHYRSALLLSGGNKNCSSLLHGISIVTKPTVELQKCFTQDGPYGLSSDVFPGLQDWRSQEMKLRHNMQELEKILAQVPGLVKKLEQGLRVLDGGCGEGRMIMLMAERFPQSSFTGFDIEKVATDNATTKAQQLGLQNVHFEAQDGCSISDNWSGKFDLFMAFNVVHHVPEPDKYFAQAFKVLTHGGRLMMSELDVSSELAGNLELAQAVTIYGFSVFECLPTAIIDEKSVGLGAAWGVQKQEMYIKRAGFKDITFLKSENKMQAYSVSTKP